MEYFKATKKEYAQKHINTGGLIDQFIENIADSPKVILIMQHTEDHRTYDQLFKYIENHISETHPSKVKREKPQYIKDVDLWLQEVANRKSNSEK